MKKIMFLLVGILLLGLFLPTIIAKETKDIYPYKLMTNAIPEDTLVRMPNKFATYEASYTLSLNNKSELSKEDILFKGSASLGMTKYDPEYGIYFITTNCRWNKIDGLSGYPNIAKLRILLNETQVVPNINVSCNTPGKYKISIGGSGDVDDYHLISGVARYLTVVPLQPWFSPAK